MTLTGRKLDQKQYTRHSGEPGGFRSESYGDLLQRKPELPIQKAVKGMLPRTPSAASFSPSSRFTPVPTTRTRPRSPSPSLTPAAPRPRPRN